MNKNSFRYVIAGVCSAFMLASAPVMAQSAAEQQQAPAQQAPAQQSESFSDNEVEKFAASYSGITEVRERFSAELQKADDAEEAHKIQQQANDEMVGVIESNDLTIQEYNAIAEAMQGDPELRERVLALLD